MHGAVPNGFLQAEHTKQELCQVFPLVENAFYFCSLHVAVIAGDIPTQLVIFVALDWLLTGGAYEALLVEGLVLNLEVVSIDQLFTAGALVPMQFLVTRIVQKLAFMLHVLLVYESLVAKGTVEAFGIKKK